VRDPALQTVPSPDKSVRHRPLRPVWSRRREEPSSVQRVLSAGRCGWGPVPVRLGEPKARDVEMLAQDTLAASGARRRPRRRGMAARAPGC